MARQSVKILSDVGSKAFRVGDALMPMTGTAAPDVNAEYFGQLYINTTAKTIYISVAVGSATAANDWKQVTTA